MANMAAVNHVWQDHDDEAQGGAQGGARAETLIEPHIDPHMEAHGEAHGEAHVEAPVLDLVHLSRQTFGDHPLETELLTLFDRQAGHFAERLRAYAGLDDTRGRIELTHMMRGSASAVGAFGVARAAEDYEAALRAGGLQSAGCDTLLAEIEKARAAIAELM